MLLVKDDEKTGCWIFKTCQRLIFQWFSNNHKKTNLDKCRLRTVGNVENNPVENRKCDNGLY